MTDGRYEWGELMSGCRCVFVRYEWGSCVWEYLENWR